jgi:hypothetical protein
MLNSDFVSLFGLQIGVIAAVVAALAVWAYLRYQARRRAWSDLAARTGLALESAGWFGLSLRVTGVYRRRLLTLDTFTRSSGRHSVTYTRLVVTVSNTSGLGLALYEQGLLSQVGKLLGMQDIQVGDEELDRRFVIKGQPEAAIVNLLTFGGLRQSLLQARSLNINVEGQHVRFEKKGGESDVDYIQFLFDLLSELAAAVERIGGPLLNSASDNKPKAQNAKFFFTRVITS